MPIIPTLAPSWANFNFRWSCFWPFLPYFWIISFFPHLERNKLCGQSFPPFPLAMICVHCFLSFHCVSLSLSDFLWPFTRYLKTGIKLFLYYLFFRLNKPVSPRHKDSTPDAASQVSNTVKNNFLPLGSYTYVRSYLSTARAQCGLYSIFCSGEFPGHFNGPAFFSSCSPVYTVVSG